MSAEVGQVWYRDGLTHWVSRVDGRGVLLQAENGQMVLVPSYEWPGAFTTSDPGSGDVLRPLTAMLVGGASGRHFDRIQKLASNLGVDIEYHWPGDVSSTRIRRLPGDVDLVIVIPTHVGHAAYWKAKELTSSQGIPLALAQSRGFENELRQELIRLELRPSLFGALPGIDSSTWYELTASGWVLRSRSSGVGDTLIALALCGLTFLAPKVS